MVPKVSPGGGSAGKAPGYDSNYPALPTAYAGRVFGSRYKARWAIFMDLMDVRHVYRHDPAYPHPSLAPWEPDFYLPEMQRFLHVTPYETDDRHQRYIRDFLLRLPSDPFGEPARFQIYVIEGRLATPERFEYRMWDDSTPYRASLWDYIDIPDLSRDIVRDDRGPYLWVHCQHCGFVGLALGGEIEDLGAHQQRCAASDTTDCWRTVKLREAYEAAGLVKLDSWANIKLTPSSAWD